MSGPVFKEGEIWRGRFYGEDTVIIFVLREDVEYGGRTCGRWTIIHMPAGNIAELREALPDHLAGNPMVTTELIAEYLLLREFTQARKCRIVEATP